MVWNLERGISFRNRSAAVRFNALLKNASNALDSSVNFSVFNILGQICAQDKGDWLKQKKKGSLPRFFLQAHQKWNIF